MSADGKAYNFVFQSAEKYVATTIPYGTYTLKYTIPDGYEKSPNKDIIASGSAVTIDDNADSGRLYVILVRSDRELIQWCHQCKIILVSQPSQAKLLLQYSGERLCYSGAG